MVHYGHFDIFRERCLSRAIESRVPVSDVVSADSTYHKSHWSSSRYKHRGLRQGFQECPCSSVLRAYCQELSKVGIECHECHSERTPGMHEDVVWKCAWVR
eukprot:447022-Amphidinium_carterae.1